MEDRFPAFQYMISHMAQVETEKHFTECLAHYDATSADIVLEDLRPPNSFDQSKGFKSSYTLRWTTYKGWKVYMLMTGAYATIPQYEAKT